MNWLLKNPLNEKNKRCEAQINVFPWEKDELGSYDFKELDILVEYMGIFSMCDVKGKIANMAMEAKYSTHDWRIGHLYKIQNMHLLHEQTDLWTDRQIFNLAVTWTGRVLDTF